MARIYQRRNFERRMLSLFLCLNSMRRIQVLGSYFPFTWILYNLVRKYLYIKDTKITGNDLNASSSDTAGSGSKMFALSAIYEY